MHSMISPRAPALAFVLLSVLCLSACATTQTSARNPRDPFEPINRVTFALNDEADRILGKPVARAYRAVLPQFAETGVSNFFHNLTYPRVILSDLLQGKPAFALSGTGRLLLNSTLGLGGLLDPAGDIGLADRDEDFGQALGVWGLPSGPYLVLPIVGPTSLRDGVGRIADNFAEPQHYLEDDSSRYTLEAARFLDRRARLLVTDRLLDRAVDKYALVRSAYLQREEYQVRDGNVPEEEPLDVPEEDNP